ncbi:glycosyltransferase family 2 protein [Flavobacterium yafengii]|uniref:glycosyltransferase family 2 protein n=1 Tax=Flavobacterium yafengii TaxID=3041253 RepID=UPI0024A8AD3C|nr:glycosyltransferase family A protein [Flavobacterium yafengii]MDI6046610.1 glycosyltransferase family A protein [Flavobacterium yafengii]
MNELVSVIIPCYNQAKYLPEALQSIKNQTYQNWECIIVNDGSPDETDNIAAEWCKKDSRFKYLYQENGGLSNARNSGIKKADGKYIVTLDSDDKFEPTFIKKALNSLTSDVNIGLVCSWGFRFMGDKKRELYTPGGGSIKEFLFCNAANMGSLLFRKECWEEVGGYDEKMKSGYEDWEFYIRVCQLGWNMNVLKEPLFLYRQHAVSMRTDAINNHDTEIKKYIYHKHEALYKDHYEDLIDYFLKAIALEKKNNIKVHNKIDFRVGAAVLKPFRIIKAFFKI